MKQILSLLVTHLFFSSVYCCTCIGEATFKQEFKRSDVVIMGKIIDRKIIQIKDTLMPQIKIQNAEYTIQATRIYKGKIKDTLIKIITGLGGGDCGFEFMIGNDYVVYCSYQNKYYEQGNIVNKFLYTDICRRTRLTDDKEELTLLNKKCKYKKTLIEWFFSFIPSFAKRGLE
jgi:hypothetical protein